MKRKIISIVIFMIMITAAVIHVSGTTIEEEISIQVGDEDRVSIYLPDVHIYYHKQFYKWADVEFDNPGATVDVDLSELEIRDIIQFNQTVYIHPVDETKYHLIFTQIEYENLQQGGIELINESRGWKFYQHVNIRLDEIVDDEYYPMSIYLMGVPHFMRLPFLFYWNFIYHYQWMWKTLFPMPLVEMYGNSVEYQIHFHT
jgi:hypothetical protein